MILAQTIGKRCKKPEYFGEHLNIDLTVFFGPVGYILQKRVYRTLWIFLRPARALRLMGCQIE
jgi:hypothetical protein